MRASRQFYPANRRVFDDPRSTFAIDDARSYFASQGERYDLILSEPSKPWVAGVSGLFTTEFYAHVRRFLTPTRRLRPVAASLGDQRRARAERRARGGRELSRLHHLRRGQSRHPDRRDERGDDRAARLVGVRAPAGCRRTAARLSAHAAHPRRAAHGGRRDARAARAGRWRQLRFLSDARSRDHRKHQRNGGGGGVVGPGKQPPRRPADGRKRPPGAPRASKTQKTNLPRDGAKETARGLATVASMARRRRCSPPPSGRTRSTVSWRAMSRRSTGMWWAGAVRESEELREWRQRPGSRTPPFYAAARYMDAQHAPAEARASIVPARARRVGLRRGVARVRGPHSARGEGRPLDAPGGRRSPRNATR